MAEIRLDLREADGGLPDVCMCCGEEATTTKTKNMSWYPPWINYLWIAGGPLLVITLSLIMTKRAKVQAPFCEQHQGHWFNRLLLMWGSFIVLGGLCGMLLLSLAVLPKQTADAIAPFICGGCVVLGIVWLVILIGAQVTAIRTKEITDHDIILEGVSQEFVDIMEDTQRERRARRKKRRRDEEDDEDDEPPPPVRKRPASEAITEKKRRKVVEDDEEEEEPRPRKKKRRPDDDDD